MRDRGVLLSIRSILSSSSVIYLPIIAFDFVLIACDENYKPEASCCHKKKSETFEIVFRKRPGEGVQALLQSHVLDKRKESSWEA
jgi:hypothetical protein